MLVVYNSLTGNVRKFAGKLGLPSSSLIEISPNLQIYEPFILLTFTTGMGQVPQTTLDFLKVNHINLCAVGSSGNRNWGMKFAASADEISKMYGVPIIHKFEMSGTPTDVEIVKERVQSLKYETYRIKQ